MRKEKESVLQDITSVTISAGELKTMLRKAQIYDIYKEHLENYAGYIGDMERLLFDVPKKTEAAEDDSE